MTGGEHIGVHIHHRHHHHRYHNIKIWGLGQWDTSGVRRSTVGVFWLLIPGSSPDFYLYYHDNDDDDDDDDDDNDDDGVGNDDDDNTDLPTSS